MSNAVIFVGLSSIGMYMSGGQGNLMVMAPLVATMLTSLISVVTE